MTGCGSGLGFLKSTTISLVLVVLRSRWLSPCDIVLGQFHVLFLLSTPGAAHNDHVICEPLYMGELWSLLEVGCVQGEQDWREYGSLWCSCAAGHGVGCTHILRSTCQVWFHSHLNQFVCEEQWLDE